MLKKINNLPLFWKIFFLLLINFGFFIIIFQFFLIQQIENYYLEERKQNLKEKVIMAAQISDSIVDKYRKGLIEKNEAEQEIISIFSKVTPSENEYYFIFDQNNRMIYHPDENLKGKDISNLKDIKGKLIIKDIQEKLKENNEAITDYYWQKPNSNIIAPKITYAYKIPNTNWIIASGIYLDDLKNTVLHLTKKIYYYLAMIFVISIIISYWLIFMITRRLKKSRFLYEKVQKGNFILKEENFYNDEFGLLQQALYKTIDYISSIFDKIIPLSLKLEDNAKNLKDVSKKTRDSVEVQYKNFEQISASVEETSVTIREISKLLNETSLESTNSMEICNKTLSVSKETNQIIEKIHQLFIELSKQFIVIQKDSTDIQKVLELLNEMANQTNLISLNASIEAAKSGNQWKSLFCYCRGNS
ncbi:MAG: hypothetical protein KatS3mg129_1535 [Leptospiraceae bacterium]|nr:MAG: hypothetical protein KatS3mg129_1535 [Leptospiraceae bacterium]